MAQGNLQADIFRWASWWLSDDIFVGIQDSFYESRNVDVRNNGKAISLSKAFVIEHQPTEAINVIIALNNGDIAAFGNNWWLYRKNSNTRHKITTATPTKPIISASEFHWYIYWTQDQQIHRVKSSDWWNNLTGNEEIWFHSLNKNNYHPLLVSQWSLFIGNGDEFDEVDIDDVFVKQTTIEAGSTIEHLEDLWGMIRVITRSEIWHYNVYLMQKWSLLPDQVIPLWWAGIKNSIIFEWYNYITTYWWLTALDGYKLYKMKDLSDFNTYSEAKAIYKDKLVFWGDWVVYTRGKKNKNYPDVLVAERVTSNNKTDDVIRSICSVDGELYIARSNGSTYGIDKLSTTVYWTNGYLITRAYYANDLHSVKEAVETWFWFQTIKDNETIKLSYSIDWQQYKNILTLNKWDDSKVSFSEHIRMIDQFQYIQFKIELQWNGTSTPQFYSMDFRFNVIDK